MITRRLWHGRQSRLAAIGAITVGAAIVAGSLRGRFTHTGGETPRSSPGAVPTGDPRFTSTVRPSPLPLFYGDNGFHRMLVSLPDGGLRLQFVDALIPAASQPLSIRREYRSQVDRAGVFGRGWTSTLDVRMIAAQSGGALRINEANGFVTSYRTEGSAGFAPLVQSIPVHSMKRTASGDFVREWADGKHETFDAQGRLVSIASSGDMVVFHYSDVRAPHPDNMVDASGRVFALKYEDGLLVEASDPIGRVLRYRYEGVVLRETLDPVGRKTQFEYANGRLSRLTLPIGHTLAFEYASDGTLGKVTGPGPSETSFQWRTDLRAGSIKLTATSGKAGVEVLEITPAKMDELSWGIHQATGHAEAKGLLLRETGSAGISPAAFVLPDRVIFKDLPGFTSSVTLDAKGGVAAMDRAAGAVRPGDPRASSPDLGEDWRAEVTPAMVRTGDPSVLYDKAGRPVELRFAGGRRELWTWDDADRVTSWIAVTGETTRYTYDPHNHLTSVTEDDGKTRSFQYDDADRLDRVSSRQGDLHFAHDAVGNVSAFTAPDGGQVRFTYDEYNHVVAIDVPGEGTTRIGYDAHGRQTAIIGPTSAAKAFEYDARGRLAKQTDESGVQVRYDYDAEDRLATLTTSTGETRTLTYGPDGIDVRITSLDGLERVVQFDHEGHVRKVRASGGFEVTADYDARGLLTHFREASGGSTAYKYDATGRLVSESPSDADPRTYAYDVQGRVTGVREGSATTTLRYETDGRVIAGLTDRGQTTAITYDRDGRLTEHRDTDGNVTTYSYGPSGDLVKIATPGRVLFYEYDEPGRISRIVQSLAMPEGLEHQESAAVAGGIGTSLLRTLSLLASRTASVAYGYDDKGNLATITHEDGSVERCRYDERGRIAEQSDRLGNSFRYRYDADGRLEAITGPFGDHVFAYDSASRLIEERDPVEGIHRYDYSQPGAVTIVDGAGGRTRVTLNPFGQPLVVENPLGGKIVREYDAAGRLTAYTEPNGGQIQWRYDSRENVVERRSPSGKVYTFEYDGDGNQVGARLPGGQQPIWEYDARGRLARASLGASKPWSYHYDGLGRIDRIEGPNGRATYLYDELDRIVSYTAPFGKEVSTSYDSAGRIEAFQVEGETAEYRYNSIGLLDSLTTASGKTAFLYDSAGRLTGTAYPNGITVSYVYGAGTRIASILVSDAAGRILHKEEYSYDARGNLAQLVDPEGTRTFQYDELSRLTEVSSTDDRSERYAYDAAGNLTRSHDEPTWRYDRDQQLVQWGTRNLEYDARGNLTAIPGQLTLGWGDAGRLVQATASGRKLTYDYDAEGRLVARQAADGVGRYLYADQRLLAEFDGGGRRRALYLPGADADTWTTLRRDGREYYAVRSPLGSLIGVLDDRGQMVKRFRYDAYGKVLKDDGDLPIAAEYAGCAIDPATGLYRFGERYFSPELRRFVSPDPLGPDRDGNWYSYALANPFRFTDSAGTASWPHLPWLGMPASPPSAMALPRIPVAAKDQDALNTFFGSGNVRIASGGRVAIVETPAGRQLWADPTHEGYRAAWDRHMPDRPRTSAYNVDHVHAKERAAQQGYGFVRLELVEESANKSHGTIEKAIYNKLPREGHMWQRVNGRLSQVPIPGHPGIPEIRFADAFQRTKLQNVMAGPITKGLPGVRRAGFNFDDPTNAARRSGGRGLGMRGIGVALALATSDDPLHSPWLLLDVAHLAGDIANGLDAARLATIQEALQSAARTPVRYVAKRLPPGAVWRGVSSIGARSSSALAQLAPAGGSLLRGLGNASGFLLRGVGVLGRVAGHASAIAAPFLLVSDAWQLGQWLGETAADVYIAFIERRDALLNAIAGIVKDQKEEEADETTKARRRRLHAVADHAGAPSPMVVGLLGPASVASSPGVESSGVPAGSVTTAGGAATAPKPAEGGATGASGGPLSTGPNTPLGAPPGVVRNAPLGEEPPTSVTVPSTTNASGTSGATTSTSNGTFYGGSVGANVPSPPTIGGGPNGASGSGTKAAGNHGTDTGGRGTGAGPGEGTQGGPKQGIWSRILDNLLPTARTTQPSTPSTTTPGITADTPPSSPPAPNPARPANEGGTSHSDTGSVGPNIGRPSMISRWDRGEIAQMARSELDRFRVEPVGFHQFPTMPSVIPTYAKQLQAVLDMVDRGAPLRQIQEAFAEADIYYGENYIRWAESCSWYPQWSIAMQREGNEELKRQLRIFKATIEKQQAAPPGKSTKSDEPTETARGPKPDGPPDPPFNLRAGEQFDDGLPPPDRPKSLDKPINTAEGSKPDEPTEPAPPTGGTAANPPTGPTPGSTSGTTSGTQSNGTTGSPNGSKSDQSPAGPTPPAGGSQGGGKQEEPKGFFDRALDVIHQVGNWISGGGSSEEK